MYETGWRNCKNIGFFQCVTRANVMKNSKISFLAKWRNEIMINQIDVYHPWMEKGTLTSAGDRKNWPKNEPKNDTPLNKSVGGKRGCEVAINGERKNFKIYLRQFFYYACWNVGYFFLKWQSQIFFSLRKNDEWFQSPKNCRKEVTTKNFRTQKSIWMQFNGAIMLEKDR